MSTATVQIIGSAVGNSPAMPLKTLNEASAAYRAFIQANDLGARDAGRCVIRYNGVIVAHVSYNGRVWEGEKWTPGCQEILPPDKAVARSDSQWEETCAS